MVTESNAKMVQDNTGHESSPGSRVVRGLFCGLCKPAELLDNPEKGCSEGVILKFMPSIRFKPVLIQLKNIKQNDDCHTSIVE